MIKYFIIISEIRLLGLNLPIIILTLRPLLHQRPTRLSPRHTHSIGPALLAQH
ncbi:MAG: hypothetical protein P1P80_07870 [ANME-2 cluster archaeon]|nr:hypothetical protein [ANME-2 cluster archaeon]